MLQNERHLFREDALMGIAILAFGVAFVFLGSVTTTDWPWPDFRQTPSFEALIGFTVTIAGLALVIWWLASMLFAVASALLFACGNRRLARHLARLAPTFMKRLAIAMLGLNLTSIPLAYADASRADSIGSADSYHAAVDPAWKLRSAGPPSAAKPPPPGNSSDRVVGPGESLWAVASRTLGSKASAAEIAAEWPRWYAANRAIIGADPDLVQVGTVLRVPNQH